MGGDEVNLNCWNSTAEITSWMNQNGMGVTKKDFLDLWSMFQNKGKILINSQSQLNTFNLN